MPCFLQRENEEHKKHYCVNCKHKNVDVNKVSGPCYKCTNHSTWVGKRTCHWKPMEH